MELSIWRWSSRVLVPREVAGFRGLLCEVVCGKKRPAV